MYNKVMRISPSSVVFFECDIQVKLAKHIKHYDSVMQNAARMA